MGVSFRGFEYDPLTLSFHSTFILILVKSLRVFCIFVTMTKSMKKVLVFGTFDGLHEGHKNFFKQAKEFGDHLIAVVGRDSTIVKAKGRLPKFGEQERLKALQECGMVDEARLGNENMSPYIVIKEINPDVICLGYDQTHFTDKLAAALKEMGLGHVKIERLKAFEPEKYHSSL